MSDEPKKVICITRREIAERWCEENGVTIDDMSNEQSFRLRKLSAWQNAP